MSRHSSKTQCRSPDQDFKTCMLHILVQNCQVHWWQLDQEKKRTMVSILFLRAMFKKTLGCSCLMRPMKVDYWRQGSQRKKTGVWSRYNVPFVIILLVCAFIQMYHTVCSCLCVQSIQKCLLPVSLPVCHVPYRFLRLTGATCAQP
jgi:hypothetical protein